MKKILISINPQYVERILDGTKRYEFRTKSAKQDIDSLIIYSTNPTKKVVAEAEIIEVLAMSPDELWTETKNMRELIKKALMSTLKIEKQLTHINWEKLISLAIQKN